MRRYVVTAAGFALVALAVYLVSLNSALTEFRFTRDVVVNFPLGGIVIGSFLSGALLVLAAVALQSGRRAFSGWRQTRRRRQREHYESLQQRGAALVWEGDVKQAHALLEKAHRRRPDDPAAVLALARSYRAAGESRRALELLADAAAKRHNTNPEILLALAAAQKQVGDSGAQLETLERLRALHPRAALALNELRRVYVDAGRWHDAVAVQEVLVNELRDSVQAAREQERLLALRYQACLQIADSAERAKALAALAERRSLPVPVAISLGDALLAGDDSEQAWSVWERGLRATPRTAFVERLEKLAHDPRHQERLQSLLHKLRPEDSQAENARLFVAQLQLRGGKVTEAGRELESLPESGPLLLQRLRAEILQKRGQAEQALLAYSQTASDAALEYRCNSCGRASSGWLGYCPTCHSWDSYRSTVEIGRQ